MLSTRWNPQDPHILTTHADGKVHLLSPNRDAPIYTQSVTDVEDVTRPIAWKNSNECSIGVYDRLTHIDIRMKTTVDLVPPATQYIHALDWDLTQKYLALSDESGTVRIYDASKTNSAFFEYQHEPETSIKALQWNPMGRSLASGGGKDDGMLHIVNPFAQSTSSLKIGMQICSLFWLDHKHVFAGLGRGHTSEDNIQVYQIQDGHLLPLEHLSGHTHRVVAMTKDPDSSQYATLSGDRSSEKRGALKLWTAKQIPITPPWFKPKPIEKTVR